MVKPEWGTKRVCQSCGTVYYDMKKMPPICPKCGTKFDPEALLKSRRGRQLPDEAPTVAEVDEEEKDLAADELEALADDEIEVDGDEEDDESLIEDASELGEDEDEIGVDVDADQEDR